MSATSSHLTLEELIAHVTGAPAGAATELHLSTCPGCRSEARSWQAVAGGMHHLSAAADPPPTLLDGMLDTLDRTPAPLPALRRLLPPYRRALPPFRRQRRPYAPLGPSDRRTDSPSHTDSSERGPGSPHQSAVSPEPVAYLSDRGAGSGSSDRGADWPYPGVGSPERGAGPRRRRVALASAAAVFLIGGGVYGVSSVFAAAGGPAGGTQQASDDADFAAALTPTDCTDLKVMSGTLEKAGDSSLVLRTITGRAVTVTTTGATAVTRQVAGALADITNGAKVMVQAESTAAAGKTAAQRIGILPQSAKLPAPLSAKDGRMPALGRILAARGRVSGTVTDVSSGGFTVVDPGGSRVQVTTSPSTVVVKQVGASLRELETGKFTVAVGSLGKDKTLAASAVQQNALSRDALPELPARIPDLPRRPHASAPAAPKLPDNWPTARPSLPAELRNLPVTPLPVPGPLPRELFSGLGCDAVALAMTGLFATGR